MLTTLLMLCALIWVPIFFHQIMNRGFWVLVIWLLIAPVVTNLIQQQGRTNPFFETYEEMEVLYVESEPKSERITLSKWQSFQQNITLWELLSEPSRIVFCAFLIVFFIESFLGKKYVLPLNKTERWMIAFTLIMLANIFLMSRRIPFSLRSALDAFIIPFSTYYITRRLVTNEDRFYKLTQILAYLGFYVILSCLGERLVQKEVLHRLHGPFNSPDHLHMIMAVVFYMVLNELGILSRGVRRFVLYLIPIIIFLTWSRGTWVGFLSGVWVFMFLARRLLSPLQKIPKIGLLLIFLPILLIGAYQFIPEEIIESRIAKQGTVNWRLERWGVALQAGAQQPIFGVGFNNLREIFAMETGSAYSSHNSFVTFFAELGVVGLLAYLAIVASIIQMGLQLYWIGAVPRNRWRGIAIIAIWTAYQISALFASTLTSHDLGSIYIYVFTGGIAGLCSQNRSVPLPYAFSKTH